MFGRVLLTHGEHGRHGAAGGGEEEHVVRVTGGAHKGARDVAANTEGAELLDEVVAVGGPEDGAEDGALPGAVLDVEEVGVGAAPADVGDLLLVHEDQRPDDDAPCYFMEVLATFVDPDSFLGFWKVHHQV